jgi:1-pyrroline-5-carboxylate dehydrogenase
MQALTPFTNEPFSDFSNAANHQAFSQALAKVAQSLGGEYPLVVGGQRHKTGELIESFNPAHRSQLLGKFHGATVELANQAIEIAAKTFESWRRTPAAARSEYLFKAAKLMRQRKHEFSTVLVYEVGKSWAEADGDTAEAIDFLEFYGRENLRYADKQPLTAVVGEQNELVYLPVGVSVVIPPWNFPLAILVGMTAAAFVTGNTVVLKPSSDAPLIAMKFFELLEEIGLPAGVVNFLPGRGGKVGDALVKHPKTRLIAFTGSKAVGLNINDLAAKTSEGQIWIKRVIAEMGGKDAIIVDDEADVEAAAEGVMRSAFGFQGQKCSACSRAIVHEKVYDSFNAKLKDKVATLKVGDPADLKNYMGPVVNQKAYNSILEYIRIGKQEGKLLCGGETLGDVGFFIAPTVFIDVDPRARISQEEIFGPLLAVSKVKSFDEALQVANATEYGLTGAVYSKNEEKLKRAIQEFHVGNLYLNRKCTGALVGAHPFGGFNMSGTDSKAGGRDYLLLFMQAKLWSKKI